MIQHDVRLALAAMPVSLDPQYSVETKKLYSPLQAAGLEGVTAVKDIGYGAHARNKLDIYHVPGAKAAGVVLYIPGGGFTGGDKAGFANIGSYFARKGYIGAAMNYRLTPEVVWPAGAQDIDQAVAWLKANAARFDADGTRIYLFGHSAGASHTASFLFDPEIRGHEKVRGGVMVSGPSYALRAGEVRGGSTTYFGQDVSRYERMSVVNHVAKGFPVMLAVADLDPGFLVTPTLELAIALTRANDRCPPLLRLEGHNHFSPPCSIGTSDDSLGSAITGFIKAIRA